MSRRVNNTYAGVTSGSRNAGEHHTNNVTNLSAKKLKGDYKKEYGSVVRVQNPPFFPGSNVPSTHFVSKVCCDRAEIRYGSTHLSRPNKHAMYEFRWCSMTNQWALVLSKMKAANGEMASVEVRSANVVSISACSDPPKLLIRIRPTEEFASIWFDTFNLQPENSADSTDPRLQCIYVKLNEATQSEQAQILLDLRNHAASMKLDCLNDSEADDIISNLFAEQPKKLPSCSGPAVVIEEEHKGGTQLKQTFFCLRIGIGAFEMEEAYICLNYLKRQMIISPDKSFMSALLVPVEQQTCFGFDKDNLVAIFEFSTNEIANPLTTKMAQSCATTKKRFKDTAQTKLSHSILRLRILFKPNETNIGYLPAFMRSFGWDGNPVDPRLCYEAFPTHDAFRKLRGRSTEPNTLLASSAISNPSRLFPANNIPKSRRRTETACVDVNPCPSASTSNDSFEFKENNPKSSLSGNLSATSIRHSSAPSIPATATVKSGARSASVADTGRDVKKAKTVIRGLPDVITLEDSDLTNDSKNKKSTTASRPSRRPAYVPLFPNCPESIIDEFEKVLKLVPTTGASPTKQRGGRYRGASDSTVRKEMKKTETKKVASTSAAEASGFVDLCDDDDVDSGGTQSTHRSSSSEKFVVPEGAHPIFHHLHNFGEVTLINSLVTPPELLQLAKGQMLGDGIVQMMIEKMRYSCPKEEKMRVHIFPYFFFQTYLNAMRIQNVDKLTEIPPAILERLRPHVKVNVFEYEYLLVPVLYEQHWYLMIVAHPGDSKVTDQEPCFIMLDSLASAGSKERHRFTINMIELFLKTEYLHMYKKPKDYRANQYPRITPKVPQQQNGVDCGVFMLRNIIQFMRCKPIFGSSKNPLVDYAGKQPDLSDWYRNDDIYVECMRLQILHHYYQAAQFKYIFVYRDSYIPSLIEEMLTEKSVNDVKSEDEPIVLNDSPIKTATPAPKYSKKVTSLLNEPDETELIANSRTVYKTQGALPKSVVQNLDYLVVTDEPRNFLSMGGALLRNSHAPDKNPDEGAVELSATEKIKRRTGRMRVRREQKAAAVLTKVPMLNGVKRMTAEQIYNDFLQNKGHLPVDAHVDAE